VGVRYAAACACGSIRCTTDSRRAHLCAALSRVAAGTASPQTSAASSARPSRSSSSACCPPVKDHTLEQHVVEADALAEPGATGAELGGQRGQPHLEELEECGRNVGPGSGAPLGRGGSRQSQHLGGDAVEEHRVALLVAALQVEEPSHEARSVVRRRRRSSGRPGQARASGARSMALAFHCRRATTCEKKLGQKLRRGGRAPGTIGPAWRPR
jgi:hypothetical protein